MNELELKEKYCKLKGFEKAKGYRVDTDVVSQDYSYAFLQEPYVLPCEFWHNNKDTDDDFATDDIDELIEHIEDWEDDDNELFNAFKLKHTNNQKEGGGE